mmetsp:Transcript_85775/g.223071  ORF Transcript_85775/g.223071 Transcript_85775/m.223071 type:complete len:249 (+) Transcript_85775:326-1072(+)
MVAQQREPRARHGLRPNVCCLPLLAPGGGAAFATARGGAASLARWRAAWHRCGRWWQPGGRPRGPRIRGSWLDAPLEVEVERVGVLHGTQGPAVVARQQSNQQRTRPRTSPNLHVVAHDPSYLVDDRVRHHEVTVEGLLLRLHCCPDLLPKRVEIDLSDWYPILDRPRDLRELLAVRGPRRREQLHAAAAGAPGGPAEHRGELVVELSQRTATSPLSGEVGLQGAPPVHRHGLLQIALAYGVPSLRFL